METQKVSELQDINSIGLQDEIPVLTDKIDNVVEKISYNNLLASSISSDEDNIILIGNDGKLYASSDTDISILEEKVETLENNVTAIQGNITTLTDRIYIKDTYKNGTDGYIVWSNGYCEQWGKVTGVGTVINLLKKYEDVNYNITSTQEYINRTSATDYYANVKTKNDNNFSFVGNASIPIYWKTSGFLATGEF